MNLRIIRHKKLRKLAAFTSCFVVGAAIILSVIFLRTEEPDMNVVIVPHHDVVKTQRLEFWRQLAGKIDVRAVHKVIVVGPDHFGLNERIISYDSSDWTTSDDELSNFAKDNSGLSNHFTLNTGLVKSDHAVVNLVNEIKQNFPKARFTPFLVGAEVKFEKLRSLRDYIVSECAKDSCLAIASVDFSHYVKEPVARTQDERTISILSTKSLNDKSLNQRGTIEADSPQALFVAQEIARPRNLRWWLQNQTNSAFGDPEATDTTSHVFAGYLKR